MGPTIRPGAQAGCSGFNGQKGFPEGYLEILLGNFDPGNFFSGFVPIKGLQTGLFGELMGG
jgi:hypothetical protein